MPRSRKPISLRVNGVAVWRYLLKETLSQNELANRLGVSSGYMSQVMRGHRGPSPKLRRKMLEVLSPLSFEDVFVISDDGVKQDEKERTE